LTLVFDIKTVPGVAKLRLLHLAALSRRAAEDDPGLL
jgi:hypothetical protein